MLSNHAERGDELLFHFQALISSCVSEVTSVLQKRHEIKQESITSWCDISRLISEDIFTKPVDETVFEAGVNFQTEEGADFSFAIQLRYANETWTLSADISEIEDYGGKSRGRSPKISAPKLPEVVSAAEPAFDWLVGRAKDFNLASQSSRPK